MEAEENHNIEKVYSNPIYIDTPGIHFIRYHSYDNAGNLEPIKTKKVKVVEFCDNIPPLIDIILDGTMGENNWFISIVNYTIRTIDSMSGVETLSYNVSEM